MLRRSALIGELVNGSGERNYDLATLLAVLDSACFRRPQKFHVECDFFLLTAGIRHIAGDISGLRPLLWLGGRWRGFIAAALLSQSGSYWP
jgi:hypothetical protein